MSASVVFSDIFADNAAAKFSLAFVFIVSVFFNVTILIKQIRRYFNT